MECLEIRQSTHLGSNSTETEALTATLADALGATEPEEAILVTVNTA